MGMREGEKELLFPMRKGKAFPCRHRELFNEGGLKYSV